MAEHIWSVLCYRGVIDKFTNQVSLLDVLEALSFDVEPPPPKEGTVTFFRTQAQVVSFWIRSDPNVPETVRWRVRIRAPSGRVTTGDTETEADLSAHFRARSIVEFPALPFDGMGMYRFDVQAADGEDWITKASLPLELKLLPQQSTVEATSDSIEASPDKTKGKRKRPRK